MTEACRAVLDFAFNKIGFAKVHARHHADNPANGRVMQKSGMRFIGMKYREVPDCERISGGYCFCEVESEGWKEDKKWNHNS